MRCERQLASILLGMMLLQCVTAFSASSKQSSISPLADVIEFNAEDATCAQGRQYFTDWHHKLEEWVDILNTRESLSADLAVLLSVKNLIQQAEGSILSITGHSSILIDLKNKKNQVMHKLRKLSLTQVTSDWASTKIDQIMQYVEVLNKAKTADDKVQLVQTVLNLITQLTDDIHFIQSELANHPYVDAHSIQDKYNTVSQALIDCEEQWSIEEAEEAEKEAKEEEEKEIEAEYEAAQEAEVEAEAAAAAADSDSDSSDEAKEKAKKQKRKRTQQSKRVKKHKVGEDGEDGSSYYDGVTGETEYYSSEYESGSEVSDSEYESASSEGQSEDAGVDRRRKVKPPKGANADDEDESDDEEVPGKQKKQKRHHAKKIKKKHHKKSAAESTEGEQEEEKEKHHKGHKEKKQKQKKVIRVRKVKKHSKGEHAATSEASQDASEVSEGSEASEHPVGSSYDYYSDYYSDVEFGEGDASTVAQGFAGEEGSFDVDVGVGASPDFDQSSEEGFDGAGYTYYPGEDGEEGGFVITTTKTGKARGQAQKGDYEFNPEEGFEFSSDISSDFVGEGFDLDNLLGGGDDDQDVSSGSEQIERIEEEIGQLINQVGQEQAQASMQNCCPGCCNGGSGQVIVVVVNDDGSSESSESSSSSSSDSSSEETGYEFSSEEGGSAFDGEGGEGGQGYGEDGEDGEGDGYGYGGEGEEGDQYGTGEGDGEGGEGGEGGYGDGEGGEGGYGEGDGEGGEGGYGEGDGEGGEGGYGEGDGEGGQGEGEDGYGEGDGSGEGGFGESDGEGDGGEFVEDFGGFTDLFGVEETSGGDDDAEEFSISEDPFLDWGEDDGGFEDDGGEGGEGGEGSDFDDGFGMGGEEDGEGGEGGPLGRGGDGEGGEGEEDGRHGNARFGFDFEEGEEGDGIGNIGDAFAEEAPDFDGGEEEYNFLFFTPDNPEEQYEVDNNAKEVRPFELELHDSDETRIADSKEYSFGFWTRYRFNAEIGKVLEKPDFMGLARLTINENNADVTNLGDRTLSVFIGRGYYHFATYDLITNDVNVNYNIDYETFLDNRWVYVYFGYKETNEKVGTAIGYLIYSDKLVLKTDFPGVLHKRVGNYIKYQVGSVNTPRDEYNNFNGLITSVIFSVNRGAFIKDENVARALVFEKFAIKFDRGAFNNDGDVLVSEEKIESDREDTEIEPHEWDNEYRYPQSYAVTLWYRYLRTKPVPWQTVFRFTTNEREIFNDQLHHGDRTLAVFQNQEAMVHFTSYTVGKQDSINFIADDAILPANNVQLWTYIYFAYSGKDATIRQFLNSEDFTFDKGAKAVHYVSKYFALYLGNDGYYSPLNGKFAYVTVHFGEKAWIPLGTEVTTLQSYVDGDTKLVVHEIQDHDLLYEKKEIDHSEEDQIIIEHEDGGDVLIDGVPEYGYGFWSKFMITSPKRIDHKPDMLQICRLYNRRDVADAEKSGDRTLATFLGRGVYYFATYNWDVANTYQTISYGGQLDGYWNYIYFAYQKSKARATAFVIFGADKTIQRQQFANVNHDPLNKYVRFYIGKQFDYIGFNGNVAQVVLRIGPGAHISDPEPLADLLIRFPQPEQKYPIVEAKVVVDEATESEVEGEPQVTLWDDGDAHEATEYSVSGWFKFKLPEDVERKPCHMVFRLTNNHEGMLSDTDHLGDRTLATFQCTDLTFATYTIGSIDDGYLTNQFNTIQSGEYCGLWQYIYMGYSRFARRVDYFAGYPDITRDAYFTDVLHFAPKYFALYIGNDGVSNGFPGLSKHVVFRIGTGSYVDCKRRTAQEDYPLYLPFRLNNYVTLFSKTEDEAMNKAPAPLDDEGNQPPAADIIINTNETPELDIEGINEYGYGLWTRWTMAYPRRILEKSDWHQIIRMSTTLVYEDVAKMGNRALAVFVGKGFYHFSSYDIVRDLANVYANIDYGQELEGYWNFIYFGYKRFLDTPRAVGYTYFSHIKEIRRVEIPNVKHWLLRDYVRVVVGAKEFSYMPFNGRIYDLRLYFGAGGFVQSAEDLAQTTMVAFRQQPPYRAVLQNTPVLEEDKEFKQTDGPPTMIDAKFEDQFSGIFEYALSGWALFAKGMKMQPLHSLARMTINPPNIQRDFQVAGDRTLSIFVSKTSYVFSTYDYGNLEINDDDDADNEQMFDYNQNVMQWTFFYFGYSFHTKQAYAYVKYVNRMDSYVYKNVNHFVPHYIRVFIGNDGLYPQFMGNMRSWYLGTGPAAFTLQPELLITQWPVDNIPDPDRIMSALLNNQGVNSGKLLRTGQA